MNKNGEKTSQIFFLNVGVSKEHVGKAIDTLQIEKTVIFSSIQLREETEDFTRSLTGRKVDVVEVHYVDPFTPESMRNIISLMLTTAKKYSAQGMEVVAGLTGGTNIMAVALGVVAMMLKLQCNYILNKDDDFLLRIDTFKNIDDAVTLEQFERFFEVRE